MTYTLKATIKHFVPDLKEKNVNFNIWLGCEVHCIIECLNMCSFQLPDATYFQVWHVFYNTDVFYFWAPENKECNINL